jgi:dTDP-4-amino-4,6-dideoxygalactose transaminase
MDLRSDHRALRKDLLKIWEDALDSAAFVGGAAVDRFENDFARFCEAKHAVGVGNGTDALMLAFRALQIGEGDEVIVPANSFVATAEAVVHTGAIPVFVDVDPRTYNIDVDQIEDRITSRTRALIPVHLYGQPADMDPILEIAHRHGLRVIEDASQAHGARYHGRRAGSMGDVACFSFYPAKNLGACGDAGAVVTNDSQIAEAVRRLRDHGGLRKYEHDVVGYNSRLDSIQAAILALKLRHLDERNALRRRHADFYKELLTRTDGIVTPVAPQGIESVHHLYVIRVEQGSRNDLQSFLAGNGVQTGIHYPAPIHRTQAFARFNAAGCPVAERNADHILSLPMYPEIDAQQLEYTAFLIGEYVRSTVSLTNYTVAIDREREAINIWSI